jgi:hypothetical protein
MSTTTYRYRHRGVPAVVATINVGGEVRVLLNGGTYSNTEMGAVALPLLSGGNAGFTTFEDIAPTPARVTYTLRLQARAVGVLASVTLAPRATSLTVVEYATQ